jgi:hypothetical protein
MPGERARSTDAAKGGTAALVLFCQVMRTRAHGFPLWGRALLVALAAVLIIGMLGFYLTGPVNKVAVMANAPATAPATHGDRK